MINRVTGKEFNPFSVFERFRLSLKLLSLEITKAELLFLVSPSIVVVIALVAVTVMFSCLRRRKNEIKEEIVIQVLYQLELCRCQSNI